MSTTHREVLRAAALLVLAGSPAAHASHTAHLDEFAATIPACTAKGVWGTGIASASGTLSGEYEYAIVALDAIGTLGSGACPAIGFAVAPPGTRSALLQWPATPGATGYRIYRRAVGSPGGMEALVLAAGPVTTASAASLGCAAGGRCVFVDNGNATDPATMASLAPAATQAGTSADVRLTQRIDYGGADTDTAATTAGDDPFPGALATDVLALPAGLQLDATATRSAGAPVRCPLTGASSLLGDMARYGSDDANEDACARATWVGGVEAIFRTPAGIQSVPGELFNGQPKAGEPLRLWLVLRPACSAGSLIAPGSATCNAMVGAGNQIEKLFLTAIGSVTSRGNGATGIDLTLRQAEDDTPLPDHLTVLQSGGAFLIRGPALALQVRRLAPRLFANADQATVDPVDDRAFLQMPDACIATLATSKTTSTDSAPATASITLSLPQDCHLFRSGFES